MNPSSTQMRIVFDVGHVSFILLTFDKGPQHFFMNSPVHIIKGPSGIGLVYSILHSLFYSHMHNALVEAIQS